MEQIVLNAIRYQDVSMENVWIILTHVFAMRDGMDTFAMNPIVRKSLLLYLLLYVQ